MNDAKNVLAALRAKKAPEPAAPPAATPVPPAPDPESCPECNGRCCRDEFGYRIAHMGAECYEHVCDACYDGDRYAAPLGLYLLTQTANRNYDTYDACIVVAESEEAARGIHPSGSEYEYRERDGWGRRGRGGDYWLDDRAWARPEAVTVTRIGTADPSFKAGTVVCASFNAG